MSKELIRIAARLLSPEISDNPDDYNSNIPKWLIRKIGSHRDKLRDYAKSIRAEYDYYSKIEKENAQLKAENERLDNECHALEIELQTRTAEFNDCSRDYSKQAEQIKALKEPLNKSFHIIEDAYELDNLCKSSDYAYGAAHQDINPINWADAHAFFIAGFEYAKKLQEKRKQEILGND